MTRIAMPGRTTVEDPLAVFMAPPAGETAEETESRLYAEAEAKRVSDEIDEQLRQERLTERRTRALRILLLGQSESGKSTTLKNFQLMYTPKAFRAERITWRAVVQLNLVKSVHQIVDALTLAEEGASGTEGQELPTPSPQLRALKLRVLPLLQVEEQLMKRLAAPGETDAVRRGAAPELAVSSTWRSTLSRLLGATADLEGEPSIDFDDPTDPAHVLNLCRDDVQALWADQTVRVVLQRLGIRLEDQSGFFLNDLDRLTEKRFIPSDDDVLRCRLKTLGVSEFRFQLETGSGAGQSWRIYDVGGARSQRLFWAPYFDLVDAIIFLAPISCFDQTLAEDKAVNRLEDSVLLWKDVCENKLLAAVQIVLFLNKIDILKDKLAAGIQFSRYVTTYGNRPNDYENTSSYLKRKFGSILKEKSAVPRQFYCHFTAVTDMAATQTLLARVGDLVVRANLKDSNLI
ncbi:guanine nucleotide binding protein, alpha subunit [Exidia glandulosa HHB12029]|uniref:Guanine nucleotide binding protein, alpha subunit n=1 Tax=Exidia glandulosa HHB12029 TaxID=1314781 RepID=A0A165MQ56_EXIGL|nr:guanine nucleotide binding protein, alpha subunit [Exidia glandulosa HHB12029]